MLVYFYTSQYFYTHVYVCCACACIYAHTYSSTYACMCYIFAGVPSQEMFPFIIAMEEHEVMFAALVVVSKHVSGESARAISCHSSCPPQRLLHCAGWPLGEPGAPQYLGSQLQAAARFLFDAKKQETKR